MGKVTVLDKHTAELIAAGEVVERPSSVIKELVENSIDAGATAITVEIKSGGVRYIRITDDGEGIAREDVPVAFLRHATSKIRTGDDLIGVMTLGFRGEALASVAAVARVELITRSADEENGVHYVIEGGEQLAFDECGCAKGTTIVVRDLFYNTPARMKFLKKDVQEGNAVASLLDRLAISHPEISFRLVREGKQTLFTSGDGKLKSAIYSVFGKEFAAGMIPAEIELNGVGAAGYVCVPTQTRPNSVMQIFFINGRYCRSKTMQAALEAAYRGVIMVGKHPSCVLNVRIDSATVDVNVHPAKLEVRFTNEKPIFDAVYAAAKNALAACGSMREIKLKETKAEKGLFAPPPPPAPVQRAVDFYKASDNPAAHSSSSPKAALSAQSKAFDRPTADNLGTGAYRANAMERDGIVQSAASRFAASANTLDNAAREPEDEPDIIVESPKALGETRQPDAKSGVLRDGGNRAYESRRHWSTIDVVADEPEEPQQARPAAPEPERPQGAAAHIGGEASATRSRLDTEDYRIIGEAFNTYILVESGDEIIVIDKHAAHERLIYERLLKSERGGEAQLLLEPISVSLDKLHYDAILQNLPLLKNAGFDIEDFGPGTVLCRTSPMVLQAGDVAPAVMEIAGNLGSKKDAVMTDRMEWTLHTIACRAAIKGGDRSLMPELAALVAQLRANPEVRYCPHGRPIYTSLKKRELEKSFGRIQ